MLSTLVNSGLDLCSGGDTYVEDAYFSASERDRDREIVEFNTTEIERTQESVVIKHLADGLSPIEWESLELLVSDGGTVSPNDIADRYGRHPDSVRRALNRIDDMVSRSYDKVSSDRRTLLSWSTMPYSRHETQRVGRPP